MEFFILFNWLFYLQKQDILRNKVVDRVYKRNEILNEDQQEELTDKIIPLTDLLDSVTDEVFLDSVIDFTWLPTINSLCPFDI